MRRIPLSRGMFATVDNRDFAELSRYKWNAAQRSNTFYAARIVPSGRRSPLGVVYMHRQILGAQPGDKTDHRDGNGLNNRRRNIRICTAQQNSAAFRNFRRSKTVRYRGVTQKRNKFRARITLRGYEIGLGSFDTAIQAARAYDQAARLFFGEFASPNFDH